jgi:hypothetical protein
MLRRRIERLLALTLDLLDRPSMQQQLRAIGEQGAANEQ